MFDAAKTNDFVHLIQEDPRKDIEYNQRMDYGPKRSRTLADLKRNPTTPIGPDVIGTETPKKTPEKKSRDDKHFGRVDFPVTPEQFKNEKPSATTPKSQTRGSTPYTFTNGWRSSTNANPHSGAAPSQGPTASESASHTATPSGATPTKALHNKSAPKI
jgi:hypothetical protein